MIVGKAGKRGRSNGHAMIGLHSADDLLLAGPAERVVHVPDEFDLTVVRFRSGRTEKDLGGRNWNNFLEPFGKLNCGVVTLAGKEMRKWEFAHLFNGGSDQFFVPVAQCRAPESGHTLEIGFAGSVVDVHPLPALQDERSFFPEGSEIGVGVRQRLYITGGEVA